MTQTPDTSAEVAQLIEAWRSRDDTGWSGDTLDDDDIEALVDYYDALAVENARLRAERDELPWRPKDIRRGLILFRTSSNAHGFTNYQALTGKIDALPDAAKEELAAIMVNMAIGYSRDEVLRNGVVQQLVAEARDKALEKAAIELEINWGHIATPEMRDAIRALKEDTQ